VSPGYTAAPRPANCFASSVYIKLCAYMSTEYLHLKPNDSIPDITRWRPFRAAVLIESEVNEKWQARVSEWLVQFGCLYMVAWGIRCSSWDDSVDIAALEKYDYCDAPEAEFVMTTWHESEPLSDALFYLKNNAIHPVTDTPTTVIVHIAPAAKEREVLSAYAGA
jgi:hypothetical protein